MVSTLFIDATSTCMFSSARMNLIVSRMKRPPEKQYPVDCSMSLICPGLIFIRLLILCL